MWGMSYRRTAWSARASVLAGGNYAGCVRAAIALGHDSDTTACVAGGIAGVRRPPIFE